MNIKFDCADVHLQPRQVLRVYDAAGARVQCVQGALWVTQHSDFEDHLVDTGDAFTLDRSGLALIHALTPAELVLCEPAPQPAPVGRVTRILRPALRSAGRWIARNFGPGAIAARRLRGWYGAL
jgi:hypothetical protein